MQVLSHQCFFVVGRSKTVLLLWRHLFHVVVLFGTNARVVIYPVVFGCLEGRPVGAGCSLDLPCIIFEISCLFVTLVVSAWIFGMGLFRFCLRWYLFIAYFIVCVCFSDIIKNSLQRNKEYVIKRLLD